MIDIAICKNRKTKVYENKTIEFGKLVKRLSKTTYTSENYNEYLSFDKNIQDDIKDVGGFVGGYLKDGRRNKDSVAYRSLITLDVDYGYSGMIDFLEMSLDFECVIYTTHKHSSENERFRIVIPVSDNINDIQYEAISRMIAFEIGIDYFDDSTFESNRLMYFPSTSKDGEFRFIHIKDDILDVNTYLDKYENYKDKSTYPVSSRVNNIKDEQLKKQQNPLTKDGIIGAFCKTYNIHEVIDKYLKNIYTKTNDNSRYTYTGGSSYGGLVVYEDANFAYSHHSTDPCLNKLCNSFDLVKNHLFKNLSEEKALESMIEMASSDGDVVKTLGIESLKVAQEEFKIDSDDNIRFETYCLGNDEKSEENTGFKDSVTESKKQNETNFEGEIRKNSKVTLQSETNLKNEKGFENQIDSKNEKGCENEIDLDNITNVEDESNLWVTKLEVNKKGSYASTIDNIVIILSNDNNFKNKLALNEFSNQIIIKGNLPWRKLKNKEEAWVDTDDSNLRHYIEKVYKIKSLQSIYDGLCVVSSKNSFHPIKDYLNSLKWDKVSRIETLFIDYLGAIDNIYTRAAARKILVAGVSRIFNPGVKFDNMVVFVGKQGIGKSHIVNLLGKSWYTDSINTVVGKEAYEQLQEAWLVEMAELSATKKAEVESVKHFISKREDMYRVAYGRRVQKFKRQCVFFGTTNEDEFLKDRTGNRRFWPIRVGVGKMKKDLFKELDDYEIDNIWAEAYELYKSGESLILSKEEAKEALKSQEHHLEVSPKEGMIREYLNKLLPSSWDKMDIYARRSYISGGDFSVEDKCDVRRSKVCAMEIWVELFGGDPKMLSPYNAREINDILRNIDEWKAYDKGDGKLRFGGLYGKQRAFVLDE